MNKSYDINGRKRTAHRSRLPKKSLAIAGIIILLAGAIFTSYKLFWPYPITGNIADKNLVFDNDISAKEKESILSAIKKAEIKLSGENTASLAISTRQDPELSTVGIYVPVMNAYTTKLNISSQGLNKLTIYAENDTYNIIKESTNELFSNKTIDKLTVDTSQLPDDILAFVPIDKLSDKTRLLSLDGAYYLDSFDSGAIFRQIKFSGQDADKLSGLKVIDQLAKDKVLKVNMTGVTALTRLMMRKLQTNNDPIYFSAKIADFLKNADITHVSNEVSFKTGCSYSNDVFCSDPRFIETLKASGVNVVELTGNHNNDVGNQFNTETINKYHELGWQTFGGGLNSDEAAKPLSIDKKNSKLTLLGYNYADSPGGGPIAKSTTAGANSFDFDKIKNDIEKAKQADNFVIVDVQFWECYSYPDGYVEFPICDQPIKDQQETFRKIVDLGADIVIGTQAHQPQTYEIYKGKQIYYGLGNLYFEQTQWPGTERGIILTHYFHNGKLLQTRLTPTIYDKDFQVRVASEDQASFLLNRLKSARSDAKLADPFTN